MLVSFLFSCGKNDSSPDQQNPDTYVPPAAKSGTWRLMTFRDNLYIGDRTFFVLSQTAYIISGKNVYTYEPTLNKLVQIEDFPGGGERGGISFMSGNKGYYGIISSTNDTTSNKNLWELDPGTKKWLQKKDVGFDVNGAGSLMAAPNGNKVYVKGTSKPNVYSYEPITDEWKFVNRVNANSRYLYFIFYSYGNKILLDGEQAAGAWEMDLTTNLWTKKSSLNGLVGVPRPNWVSTDKCISLMGGFSAIPGNDLYEFNTNTEKWNLIPYTGGNGVVEGFTIGNKLYTVISPNFNRTEIWEYTF